MPTTTRKVIPATLGNKAPQTGNPTPKETKMSVEKLFPHRQIFSRLVFAFIDRLNAANIPIRALTTPSSGSTFVNINPSYRAEIKDIYNDLVTNVFKLPHEELLLLRAVCDDSKPNLSDKCQEICRVLDVLMPRYKDRPADSTDRNFAAPLPDEPVLTLEEIVEMFLKENYTYIRRRFTHMCLEANTSILPVPEPEETTDLEYNDGEWLVNQASGESIALVAAMNYTTSELRRSNFPRFQYISRCLTPLNEIASLATSSTNPVISFLNGGGNALFAYMAKQRDDESDIEAIDLFGMFSALRADIRSHRKTAKSIQTRLNNGKPAYKDLLNLAARYRGTLFWNLEAVVRLSVPMMQVMFEDPEVRPEVVRWLKNCGVLDYYQTHKRFHIKHESKND